MERLLQQAGLGAHCELVPQTPGGQGQQRPQGRREPGPSSLSVEQTLPSGGVLKLELSLQE